MSLCDIRDKRENLKAFQRQNGIQQTDELSIQLIHNQIPNRHRNVFKCVYLIVLSIQLEGVYSSALQFNWTFRLSCIYLFLR